MVMTPESQQEVDLPGDFSDQLPLERMVPSEQRGSHEEDPIHRRADSHDPPAPDCRVVRFQAALSEQLLDIAERERVPKVPATAHRISSGSVCRHLKIADRIACFMISSGYQPPSAKVATQP